MRKNNNIIFLRALAILTIVFGHSIIIYDNEWLLFSTTCKVPVLAFLKKIINVIQMPIWFTISGFLFYYTIENKKELREVLLKKLKKIIIPFISIGILYLLPIRLLIKYPGFINNSLMYNIFINILLGKDNGHLWFLPTLFFIFGIFFFWSKINKNRIISVFTGMILFLLSIFSSPLPSYLGTVAKYSIFFYLGIIINKLKIKQNLTIICFIPLIIGIVIFNLVQLKEIIYNILLVVIQIIYVIMIMKIDFSAINCKIINELADNSFRNLSITFTTYIHFIYLLS